MSDHLLRDMADPYYLARERISKEMRIKSQELKLRQRLEAEKYLPMRLLARFGEIEWVEPSHIDHYCHNCNINCVMVGRLWIPTTRSYKLTRGNRVIFCPDCFYILQVIPWAEIHQKTT